MTDARDIVAAAVPCNIVYGRPQAADDILQALTAAGYRILGPNEFDPVTVERCANEAASWQETANKLARDPQHADRADLHMVAADMARDVSLAIRAIASGGKQ